MSLERRAFFRIGTHWDAGPILKHLPEGYAIHTHRQNQISGQMLETFEGHLRKSGQLLIQSSKKLFMIDLLSGVFFEQVAEPGWEFSDRLQDGAVSDRLRKVSRLRAFSEIGSVGVELRQIVVTDEMEKTVVRAHVLKLSHEEQHATCLVLEPMRGYDDELTNFASALVATGFEPFNAESDYYPMIGIEQTLYTSKPEIVFGWDTSVYDSANRIVAAFLNVAQQNEEGILADRDTEFLHDFRVSLRRVRSLLSLFRDVYADEDCRSAGRELTDIMKQTNRLRDLDVYLMDRTNFFALVPDSMHRGLQTLFDVFARERHEAFEQVCGFLQSEPYRELIDDLHRRFSVPEGMARGGAAGEATGHFASRMVMKRYGKVAKLARSISKDTPDETVHALRIQCKKLRYLMEFFAPLYTEDDVKPLVKALKGLQDGLGHFNDCSVQRAALTAFLDDHPMRGKKGIMLAESVGALVATLYQMQLRARSEIDESLGDFANDQTNQRFKAVFAGGDS